ncbi:unnamed protein product [Heterobilharzia americana]|nr:unnamed protein product [Heterobilharzia americana]
MKLYTSLFELISIMFTQTFDEAVLFLGGVRWLNSSHMKQLKISLDNQKAFRSVKVFIKDYSAGFHTPVDGLPFIDVTKRRTEQDRNYRLVQLVEAYKWSVLPTHNITWSRLDHFHAYARCSCHFYQLEKQNIHSTRGDSTILIYRIVGQIQWIMSRIVETIILQNTHYHCK